MGICGSLMDIFDFLPKREAQINIVLQNFLTLQTNRYS